MYKARSLIPQKWVLPLALLGLLLPVVILEIGILRQTGGVFCYGLDDPFIHLAIGKNLAQHGVWGTTPYEFVSASSSILFPLLIAGLMKLTGPIVIVPFILNLGAAIVLLIVVQNWLKKQGLSPMGQLLILFALIYLTPLPITVMIGMEHTLQLLLCFLFVTSFSNALAGQGSSGAKSRTLPWKVLLYGALMMACRYECGILIITAALILLFYERIVATLQLVIFSFLPIVLFGIYALYNGSNFIPNSVLLKSRAPQMTLSGLYDFFTSQLYERLVSAVGPHIYNSASVQRLVLILPLMYVVFFNQVRLQPAYRYIIFLLTAGLLAHLSFANTDRSSRYEAYLVGCSMIFILFLIIRHGGEIWHRWSGAAKWASGFIAFILYFPLVLRSGRAFTDIGQASINIFDQQYQMGAFFHKYYNNEGIALNDIGAVSYLTEGRKLDLIGLSSNEIAKARLSGNYTPQVVARAVNKDAVKVAVLFDFWFPPQFYAGWIPVGTWTIKNNIICLGPTVTFFAVDTSQRQDLKDNLQKYERLLPKGVQAVYY
jgi:hypothetical protein